jgi:hypothetical protein
MQKRKQKTKWEGLQNWGRTMRVFERDAVCEVTVVEYKDKNGMLNADWTKLDSGDHERWPQNKTW